MVRLVSMCFLLVLALPASAAADGMRLITKPVQVGQYQMKIVAEGAPLSSVEILFTRVVGSSRQTHTYSFDRRVRLRASRSLRRGSLRADLGRFGRLSLSFAALGRLRGARPPSGCFGGRHRTRLLRLRGSLRLVADQGSYFGTVTARPLRGRVTRRSGIMACDGMVRGGVRLAGEQQEAGTVMQVSFHKPEQGPVEETFTYAERRSPATHSIVVRAPRSSFNAAPNLSTATVNAFGPFLSGSLGFTATSRPQGGEASGRLTGALMATFDSVGARRFTGDSKATLTNGS